MNEETSFNTIFPSKDSAKKTFFIKCFLRQNERGEKFVKMKYDDDDDWGDADEDDEEGGEGGEDFDDE